MAKVCSLLSLWGIFLSVLLEGRNSEGYEFRRNQDPRDKGVRFGYQNPIRVAPTLPPRTQNWSPNYNQENEYDRYPSSPFFPPSTQSPLRPQRCPDTTNERGERVIQRLDRKTQTCYPVGSRAPCRGQQTNMVFHSLRNDEIHGECDCAPDTKRPLIYHPDTDACYYIYQQGYCISTQWLVIDSQNKPRCEANPCLNYARDVAKWDFAVNTNQLLSDGRGIVPVIREDNNGECVGLGVICLPDGTYKANPNRNIIPNDVQILGFHQKAESKPSCEFIRKAEEELSFVSGLEMICRSGGKLNVTKRC